MHHRTLWFDFTFNYDLKGFNLSTSLGYYFINSNYVPNYFLINFHDFFIDFFLLLLLVGC